MHRSTKRRIAVVTTSRSDYGHLRWLLHDLDLHPLIDLRLIAIGPHLSPEFGRSCAQIQTLKKPVTAVECLLSSDSDIGMAKSLGLATLGLADVLGRMRPDLVLLIADRYEMLAPASVALTLRIPIAHIEGGEITSGVIDDAVRNALTKMSHLHFACTKRAQRHIIAMGEAAWRVTWSGSLCLDDFRRAKLLTKQQLERELDVSFEEQTILVIYHPVTLLKNTIAEAIHLFAALGKLKQQIFFVYPNADTGSHRLIQLIKRFESEHPGTRTFVNLEHVTFLSLLLNVDLLIGNSSGGIIESTIKLPTVNIGTGANNFAGQQKITGNLSVAGNIQITGNGNGLQFADGTTQTTALAGSGGSAGWTGPGVPWQAGASVFAASLTTENCVFNSPDFFPSPASAGTRLVIELVSFKVDTADDVILMTSLNGGTVRHHIMDSVGYRVYADLSASVPVKVGVCAPLCTPDPTTGLCPMGQGSHLDITLSGFIYGGATASAGWTGPNTPFQNATSVFVPWNTCSYSPFGFGGGPTNNRAAIEFVSFKFNEFNNIEDVLLETTLGSTVQHHMFNTAEFKPVGYRVYADLNAPVPVRAGLCAGPCPGADPITGTCPPNSAAGDTLSMTISGFIY